jgi:hypothetical protein
MKRSSQRPGGHLEDRWFDDDSGGVSRKIVEGMTAGAVKG